MKVAGERTQFINQLPILLQKTPVSSFPSDLLWTSKVDIHSITVFLDDFSGSQQLFGVVCAELDDQGTIAGGC